MSEKLSDSEKDKEKEREKERENLDLARTLRKRHPFNPRSATPFR